MENLEFYNKLRQVPAEAIKTINAGRLKGMSDINPMWRIKAMTEAFGMCGFGWKYEVTKQWQEAFGQVVKTFCNINLYVKVDGEWSEPIPGTGGSSFVSIEKTGVYVSDEANKMALTDALSVAMKALGVAADVYYAKDATKYSPKEQQPIDTAKLLEMAQDKIAAAQDLPSLVAIWKEFPALQPMHEFTAKMTERRTQLGISKKAS